MENDLESFTASEDKKRLRLNYFLIIQNVFSSKYFSAEVEDDDGYDDVDDENGVVVKWRITTQWWFDGVVINLQHHFGISTSEVVGGKRCLGQADSVTSFRYSLDYTKEGSWVYGQESLGITWSFYGSSKRL